MYVGCMHFPLTSVAVDNQIRKVGESLVAVVALAAAEEDLRVFLHGDALLPETANYTPTLLPGKIIKLLL